MIGENSIKKSFIFVITLIVFLINLNFIFASGCCYDPTSGLCYSNSEESSCVGGLFYASSTCSVDSCTMGCCNLVDSVQYTTSANCEYLAGYYGVNEIFDSSIAQEDCKLISSDTLGACVSGGERPYSCTYVASSECSADFHAGIPCTDPSLETYCISTSETECYLEDVWSIDSCGNAELMKSNCDYNSGTKCVASGGTATCKSLDCQDSQGNSIDNGESWCTYFDGAGNVFVGTNAPTEIDFDNEEWVVPVGSRYFRQYCLDSQVYSEPCADYRNELCEIDAANNSATCNVNPWQDCIEAGNDSDSCRGDYCFMADPLDCVSVSAGTPYTSTVSTTTTGVMGPNPWGILVTRGSQSTTTGLISNSSITIIPRTIIPWDGGISYEGGYISTNGYFSVCGEDRNSHRAMVPAAGLSSEGAEETMTELSAELGIGLCVPKFNGGQEIGSSSTTTTTDSVCSNGNYETSINLDADKGCSPQWRLGKDSDNEYVDISEKKYGNAGIISSRYTDWYRWEGCEHDALKILEDNPIYYIPTHFGAEEASSVKTWMQNNKDEIINPRMIELLNKRCRALGDCDGKNNWIGVGSGEALPIEMSCSSDREDHVSCTFKYECVPWEQPSSGDCEACGRDDNLSCSEYRCKSLGENCEYYEPSGIDKGYCKSSDDTSAPSVSCTNCPSTIEPYSSAIFTVATSEEADCSFSLDSSSSGDYEFDGLWGLTHSAKLNVPGFVYGYDESMPEYEVLDDEGKYTMYVSCSDPVGNEGTLEIPFTVNQYPDTTAPSVSNFTPQTNSVIAYNTTSKYIRFNTNEPAQCKWDLNESSNFSAMQNNFSCTESLGGLTSSYGCFGTLTEITLNPDEQTTFHILCKDQPWLEGAETNVYFRNTMAQSYDYKLGPSQELILAQISPSGSLTLGGNNISFSATAITSAGAYSGVATCKYRISNESSFSGVVYKWFNKTNSNYHQETVTLQNSGNYFIQVSCNDSAENVVSANASFTLYVDTISPSLTRAYQYSSYLKILTSENSLCYYTTNSTLGCYYPITNGTLMTGTANEHLAPWKYDTNYYIKCKDYYGNENGGCALLSKTY